MTEFRYLNRRKGARVVTDFRRLLETGDIEKLTTGLYCELTMHGGFIAHFSHQGFKAKYRGRLAALLDGEFYSLTRPEAFERRLDLDDSGYTDGMSSRDVMIGICEIGRELAPMVCERERNARDEGEIGLLEALAAKHGYTITQGEGT